MDAKLFARTAILGLLIIVASTMVGRILVAEQAKLERESFQKCVAANERIALAMAAADRSGAGLDLLRYEPMDCDRRW